MKLTKQKTNITIPVDVQAEISVDEIVDNVERGDLLELIKSIDHAMRDWDFTLALCDHFEKMREAWKKEQAEDAAKATQ